MSAGAVATAQAAFEGALFLRQWPAEVGRSATRYLTEAVLGSGTDATLPVTITIDPDGIVVASDQFFRVRGRALDITEIALRRYYSAGRSTTFRLDRDTLTVRLSCVLHPGFLAGMTLEGAERVLDEVWTTHILEERGIEAMIGALDVAVTPSPHPEGVPNERRP